MILHRLPDAFDFGVGARPTHRRVRNPGDFIGHVDGRPLLIDCKETIHKTIPVSVLTRLDDKKNTRHQYEAMHQWVESHPLSIAGYICQLGESHLLVFCPIKAIKEIDSISAERVGSFGIRAIDLASQRVDFRYLFLGEGATSGNSKSQTCARNECRCSG